MMRAVDICAGYGDRHVLRHVSICASPGEVVGVLGANGAGKSTLLRTLAGVGTPQSGSLVVGNVDVLALKPTRRAQMIGYLPQRPIAEWPMPVAEIASLGRLPHVPWWQSAPSMVDAPPVVAAIEACHLRGMEDRPVDTLSGGEFARAMMARLLAGEHDVLIADEPIADLDPPHRVDVMSILKKQAQAGRAVVVALHDLMLADRFCDRVVVLGQGCVLAQGHPHHILESGLLARAYDARCHAMRHGSDLVVHFGGAVSP